MALSNQRGLTGVFQSPERQFKNSFQFRLTQAEIAHSGTLGCWFHQILFRYQACRKPDFANLGKSFSEIWLFSLSHLQGLG